MGTRDEVARTHLDLARLAHRRADLDSARSHVETAAELFGTLGVSRYGVWARQLGTEVGIGPPEE